MIKELFVTAVSSFTVPNASFTIPNRSMINIVNCIGAAQYSDETSTSTYRKMISLIYNQLGYTNTVVKDIAHDILNAFVNSGKTNLIVSKTADNEMLIYTNIDGEFRNIIIDENADVEYLFVPKQRRDTFNEYYAFAMVDATELANKL